MYFETKKGKYSEEENEIIIETINRGIKEGKKERDILKELSDRLNRGYAGVMSHVRKLRSEFPERFHSSEDCPDAVGIRQGAWEEWEEELVISTVNRYLQNGQSLSAAISELEQKLTRTQGAIYQRIYTLRRKKPEKFAVLEGRPRRRRKLPEWQLHHPVIRSLDETYRSEEWTPTALKQLAVASGILDPANAPGPASANERQPAQPPASTEEEMLLKAFEERFGRPSPEVREKLLALMRSYGPTHVSIALFTLTEDKAFPGYVAEFLERRIKHHKFL